MLALVLMSESRKTPPLGTKRPPTQRDRDALSRETMRGLSDDAPDRAVPAEFETDEITGNYEGEELEAYRSLRPLPERVTRLERKQDALRGEFKEVRGEVKEVRADVRVLASQVGDLREDVSGAVGKIEGQAPVLSEMLSIVKKAAEKTVERDHVTFTAQVDVDKAHELARVEVDKAAGLANVELAKERNLEPIKARSERRKAIAKLVGSIFVGAYALYEFLHRLGVL